MLADFVISVLLGICSSIWHLLLFQSFILSISKFLCTFLSYSSFDNVILFQVKSFVDFIEQGPVQQAQ